jgi:uncharacterized protein (TIGR02284 family)
MEENKDLVKHIVSLVQLDIDAIHAYQEAIKKIDIQDVRDKLVRFQRDHEAHVKDLSPLITQYGGQVPEYKLDLKGHLIQGFTALRSSTGTEGALKAMKGNEQLTNSAYEKALTYELPQNVRIIVEKNREDERRHLAYIENVLNQRVWESGEKIA